MKKLDAIKYAGGALKLANLVGVTSGAISQWGEVVPIARQLQLERITLGELKAAPGCFDKLIGIEKMYMNRTPNKEQA